MDSAFDPRSLYPGKSNPFNEFGAPMFTSPPQVPWGELRRPDWQPGPGNTTVWTYRTPIFDLRPEYAGRADTVVATGVPINHQGTYGLGNILQVIIGGNPSFIATVRCRWWELGDTIGGGNPATAVAGLPLLVLSQPEDITTELLCGGLSLAAEGEGGTLLQFDPPGCRFWQVVIQFTDRAAGQLPLHVRATLGV